MTYYVQQGVDTIKACMVGMYERHTHLDKHGQHLHQCHKHSAACAAPPGAAAADCSWSVLLPPRSLDHLPQGMIGQQVCGRQRLPRDG